MSVPTLKNIIRTLGFLSITVLVGACGGGGGEEGASSSQAETSHTEDFKSIVLRGTIVDGPVAGADIAIVDKTGKLVARTTSTSTATYEVAVPADSLFPLTLTATGGIDAVTGDELDFEMVSVSKSAEERIVNINPFSTMIVKTAKSMPQGVTESSLESAKDSVLQELNFGIDKALIPDPITSPITEKNMANIVKAGETFAETIRRTKTALEASATNTNEDQIIDAIAADLTDGAFDGQGTGKADPLMSQTTKVVSVEVLVEAMGNNLHVKGSLATDLMDNAIRSTMPSAKTTAEVKITPELIKQTKKAIDVVQRISPNEELELVHSTLENISNEARASDIEKSLPIESSNDVSSAIQQTIKTVVEEHNSSNLLANSSFETGDMSNWLGDGKVVEVWRQTGNYSLRMIGSPRSWLDVRQELPVTGGAKYSFSGYLTTRHMTQGSYQFQIRWYDDEGNELEEERNNFGFVHTNRSYDKYSGNLTAPTTATSAEFRLHANKADGRANFDSLNVTLLEPAPENNNPDPEFVPNSDNLLSNPSFETGEKSHWLGRGQVVNAHAKEGDYALRVFGSIGKWKSARQKVEVEAGKNYRFAGYLSTHNVTSGSYEFQVRWYNVNGDELRDYRRAFTSIQTTTSYERYSVELTSPESAVSAELRLNVNNADGHAYIDALSVVKLDGTVKPSPLVSSVQPNRSDLAYEFAFDGDQTTRWGSDFSDPQWITKDLGSVQNIVGVNLHWQIAYGKAYEIQISDDLLNWEPVHKTTASDGELDRVVFDPVDTRYIRMYGTERGTEWGFSLWEFEELTRSDIMPTLSLSASNLSVEHGSTAVLTWETTNVVSCEASGAWAGTFAATGSETSAPIVADAAFTLTCANELGDTVNQTVNISVNNEVPPPPAPTLTLSASAASVSYYSTATLSWATTNAVSCEASGDWQGSYATNGEFTTDPLTENSIFTLTCVNDENDSVTRSVDISVFHPTPKLLTIKSADASDYDSDRDRFPSNAIDDDANSKWTVTGTSHWISLDLGETRLVSQVRMSIFVGGVENFLYSIDVSTDNTNWSEVFSNGEIIQRSAWTEATFDIALARYVRVNFTTTVSNYINLYDLEIHGNEIDGTNPGTPPSVLDTLSWDANKDTIDGYVIYHGSSEDASTEYVSVDLNTSGFDANSPSVQYDSINELGYSTGDKICFRVKARNSDGYSEWSEAVCDTVD